MFTETLEPQHLQRHCRCTSWTQPSLCPALRGHFNTRGGRSVSPWSWPWRQSQGRHLWHVIWPPYTWRRMKLTAPHPGGTGHQIRRRPRRPAESVAESCCTPLCGCGVWNHLAWVAVPGSWRYQIELHKLGRYLAESLVDEARVAIQFEEALPDGPPVGGAAGESAPFSQVIVALFQKLVQGSQPGGRSVPG